VRFEEAAMHRSRRLLSSAFGFASLVLPLAVPATEVSPADVTFAPGYEVPFAKAYGEREVSFLRLQIVDSLSQSLKSAGSRCSLAVSVTLERAAPTHPTIQQQMEEPGLDPIRTVYRDGGASLTGHLLDSSGHVIATVKFQGFTGFLLPLYSPAAKDPWSEARLEIQQFSGQLAHTCVKQSASAHN
jgi:hypothetical protein